MMQKPSRHFQRPAPPRVRSLAGQTWKRDTRGAFLLSAMVWLMLAYLLIPPSYYSGHKMVLADMTSPSPIARTIKLALLAISVIIILWRAPLAWLLVRRLNVLFIVFLGFAPLSALWSIDPSATVARCVSIASIVAVCFAFTLVSWHPHRFQNVVRALLSVLVVGSILFTAAFPDLAIEVGEGTLKNAWRGLTSQKNEFGSLSSFAFVFWLHALLAKEAKSSVAGVFTGVSFVCVLLSRSSTSLLATVMSAVFMLMLMRSPSNLRRYMPYIVGTFTTIVVIYAVAVLKVVPGLDILLTPITSFTGKDLTFSNRSEIWIIIKEHIALRPYLGSGYGAYWVGPVPTSPSYVFFARMYFYPGESHNGYLEVVNDLGIVGLCVLLGYLGLFVRESLQVMHVDRNQGALYLSIFFQQGILNLSGSAWLQINAAFVFALVTLATFSIARSRLDFRLHEVFGSPGRAARPDSFDKRGKQLYVS
jgi:O-antigen ligase